jgi:hypothetical protein
MLDAGFSLIDSTHQQHVAMVTKTQNANFCFSVQSQEVRNGMGCEA